MKKSYITVMLLQFAFWYGLTAQNFPNLDLSFYATTTNIILDPDPIATNPAMAPWWLTHGSPTAWRATSNPERYSMLVFGGEKLSNAFASADPFSEGAFYPTYIEKDHTYNISAKIGGWGGSDNKVDKAYIYFASDVPDETDKPDDGTRSFDFPDVPNKQIIFYEEGFETGGSYSGHQDLNVTITADDNYEGIWITIKDNDGGTDNLPDSRASFSVIGLEIKCCPDYEEFHTTENPTHIPLPTLTHVNDKILAIADDGDILVNDGEDVTFKSGGEIEIVAPLEDAFFVESGAKFFATIEDCECPTSSKGVCNNGTTPNLLQIQKTQLSTNQSKEENSFPLNFCPMTINLEVDIGFTNLIASTAIGQTTSTLSSYPNPFEVETTIDLKVDQIDNYDLKVYDLRGKNILTILHSENLPAGTYSFSIRSTDLPNSGMYFLKLTNSNGESQIQKLILQ